MYWLFQSNVVTAECIWHNFASYPYNTTEWETPEVFWGVAHTWHLSVSHVDGPRPYRFHAQARTMSIVAAIYRRHSSKIHRLLHEARHAYQRRLVVSGIRHRQHWLRQGLFFQFRDHGILWNSQSSANITNPAAIQGLLFDLLFDIREPGSIEILPLKAFSTGITPIALGAIFAMPIFNEIITLTNGTLNLNILFHGEFQDSYEKKIFCDHVRFFILFVKYRNQRIWPTTQNMYH